MKLDFSIIIPVKEENFFLKKNIRKILNTKNEKTYEILVIPNFDFKNDYNPEIVKIISSGKVGPATKRDIGARNAMGNILIFLDDDSFISKNYFKTAYDLFDKDKELVAVGGPGILPEDQNFFGKVLGSIFLSKLAGGYPERYSSIAQKKPLYVDDWPSVNLIIKKDFFFKIGGFNCNYWPGEDTILCLKIIENGKKILYVSNLVVHHYRRGNLISHIKQISAYARMRGYFVKKYPKNSFKISYFIPSIFFIYIVLLLLMHNSFLSIPLLGYVIYLIISLIEIALKQSLLLTLLSAPIIFITHIVYGFYFIKGLLTFNDPKPNLR